MICSRVLSEMRRRPFWANIGGSTVTASSRGKDGLNGAFDAGDKGADARCGSGGDINSGPRCSGRRSGIVMAGLGETRKLTLPHHMQSYGARPNQRKSQSNSPDSSDGRTELEEQKRQANTVDFIASGRNSSAISLAQYSKTIGRESWRKQPLSAEYYKWRYLHPPRSLNAR